MKNKQEMYYDFLLSNKKWWGSGLTKTKLIKVKSKVFENEEIWWDLFDRHDGKNYNTVEEFMKDDKKNNYHGWGNFTCSIYYYAMRLVK